jgi:hypothetical protein
VLELQFLARECEEAQLLRAKLKERRALLSAHLAQLYNRAPDKIRARMQEDGRDPLMQIFDQGWGYVRLDYGPGQKFSSLREVQEECDELVLVWSNEVRVVQEVRHSSIHLTFTAADLSQA